MSDERPRAQSPELWIPRTDAGARKLIERIDAQRDEIRSLSAELSEIQGTVHYMRGKVEESVTWPKLLTIVGGVGGLVVGISWAVVSSTLSRSDNSMQATQKMMADDLRAVRSETTSKVQSIETKVDGVYKLLVEGKSKGEVKAAVRAKEQEQQESDAGASTPWPAEYYQRKPRR
jgi:glutamine synthetase adenylyltransferase